MRGRSWLQWVGATALLSGAGLGLAALLYRAGRVLGSDSYYYCELAKRYTHSWPRAFGNHWPCGYPLLGGLLARAGLPAYDGLCLVSIAGLLALVALSLRWTGDRLGRWAILALVATPEMGVQLFGALTELPFAAALLGLAAGLAAWPKRSALWLAALCAVLALGLRYAGVLTLPILWLWLFDRRRPLREARALRAAGAAVAAASAASAAMLAWNWFATGHLSGVDRGPAENATWSVLARNGADFGWSMPAALMLGGLRARLAGWGAVDFCVGWAVVLSWLWLCAWGWFKPRQPWVPALALTAAAYVGGMLAFRTVGSFDALSHPRTFLPAAFPLGLILLAQCPRPRRPLLAAAFGLWLGLGLVGAARGLSREVGGDVRSAVPWLRERLKRGDRILLNEDAYSLTAYLPMATDKVSLGDAAPGPQGPRFIVLAAHPADRSGTPEPFAAGWRTWSERLVRAGTYQWRLRSPQVEVLERRNP